MAVPEADKTGTITVPYAKQIKNGLVLIVTGRHPGTDTALYGVVLMTDCKYDTSATVIGNYSCNELSMNIENVEYKNNAFTLQLRGQVDLKSCKVAFLQLDLDGTSSGG